jgi:hypothetical protein
MTKEIIDLLTVRLTVIVLTNCTSDSPVRSEAVAAVRVAVTQCGLVGNTTVSEKNILSHVLTAASMKFAVFWVLYPVVC